MQHIARLGDSTRRELLAELQADRDVVDTRPRADNRRTRRRRWRRLATPREGVRVRRRGVVYQAAFFDGEFFGYADFVERRRRRLGGVRRQAGPSGQAAGAAAARRLRRADPRAGPAARRRPCRSCSATASVRTSRSPMCSRCSASAASGSASCSPTHRAGDTPVAWGARRHRRLRQRAPSASTPPRQPNDLILVAGLRMDQRRKLRAAGIETVADLAGRRRKPAGMAPATFAKLRAQAALQWKQHAGRRRVRRSEYELHDRRQTLARLPAPSRGRPVLRLRGRPALRRGRPGRASGLEYLWGVHEPRASGSSCRCGRTSSRRGARGVRRVHRLRRRVPRQAPGHAHLPLRAVRDHGAQAARDALPDQRGRARRPAAVRGLRRPLRHGPRLGPRLAAVVQHQEARAALHGRRAAATRTTSRRRRVRRRLPRVPRRCGRRDPDGRGRAARRRSRTTTGTTASRPCGCATGCSSSRGRRPAVARPDQPRIEASGRGALRAGPGLRRRCWPGPARRRAPERTPEQQAYAMLATASATTAASASRSGGSTSTACMHPLDEWADTRDVFVVESAEVVAGLGVPEAGRGSEPAPDGTARGDWAPGSTPGAARPGRLRDARTARGAAARRRAVRRRPTPTGSTTDHDDPRVVLLTESRKPGGHVRRPPGGARARHAAADARTSKRHHGRSRAARCGLGERCPTRRRARHAGRGALRGCVRRARCRDTGRRSDDVVAALVGDGRLLRRGPGAARHRQDLSPGRGSSRRWSSSTAGASASSPSPTPSWRTCSTAS